MGAFLVLVGALLGVALSWYLRRINKWCPHCGDVMVCDSCSQTPRSRRPRPVRGLPG